MGIGISGDVCFTYGVAFADVAVNETNFPDEVFRDYVSEYDSDEDGTLSTSELEVVTDINVRGC